jgi:hypothetical protein
MLAAAVAVPEHIPLLEVAETAAAETVVKIQLE